MHDEVSMSCDDIEKRLQPFLDDLLAEDEYKSFIGHISACEKCGKYVRSIGSLSNQLWKLGKVRVPEDIGSTIIYKFSHFEEKSRPSKFAISKNRIIISSILIFLVVGMFLGISHFRNRQYGDEKGGAIIRAEVTRSSGNSGDSEAQALLNQLETIATGLGVPEKEKIVEPEPEKESAVTAESPSIKEPSGNNKPGISRIRPLHWHFKYAEKTDAPEVKQEIQKAVIRLQREIKKKELLKDDVKRLKEERAQLEPRQPYPESMQKTIAQQIAQKDSELQERLGQIKEQEEALNRAEEEGQRLELRLTQGAEENRQKEIGRKAKLLEALNTLTIKLDYQKDDILVFAATGEKVERVLEQIIALSGDKNNFRNFTANVITLPDKENRASIYLEHDEAGILHWHIDPLLPEKKSSMLDILRESSSSIDYESGELLICVISDAGLQKLRNRIQATGASITEYGSVKSREGALSSGPMTISVYFTK